MLDRQTNRDKRRDRETETRRAKETERQTNREKKDEEKERRLWVIHRHNLIPWVPRLTAVWLVLKEPPPWYEMV